MPSRVAAFVPAPVVPMQRAVDTGMLDTTLLSDAVSRAQDEARRLTDDARTRETEARTAADRGQQAAKDAASARRTGGRPSRAGASAGSPSPIRSRRQPPTAA